MEIKTPTDSARQALELAYESASLNEELAEIEQFEALEWLKIRGTVNTNAEADRLWKSSDKGLKQIFLDRKIKSLDKLTSAQKNLTRALDSEARNQY